MARTAVPYTNLIGNAAVAQPAGTALDIANDHVINRCDPEHTVLRVTNTDAAPHTVTLKAGAPPVAWASVQGDNTFIVPAAGAAFFGPFESGRYQRNDGSVFIDIEPGHAGTITALLVPKAV